MEKTPTSEMARKQIYIGQRQQTLLKRPFQQRGLSGAEIIRQAIDCEATQASPGIELISQQAWDRAHQFVPSLSERVGQLQQPYQWNRQELHEERLSRYTRRDEPDIDFEFHS
jgi:hypothetical protein